MINSSMCSYQLMYRTKNYFTNLRSKYTRPAISIYPGNNDSPVSFVIVTVATSDERAYFIQHTIFVTLIYIYKHVTVVHQEVIPVKRNYISRYRIQVIRPITLKIFTKRNVAIWIHLGQKISARIVKRISSS